MAFLYSPALKCWLPVSLSSTAVAMFSVGLMIGALSHALDRSMKTTHNARRLSLQSLESRKSSSTQTSVRRRAGAPSGPAVARAHGTSRPTHWACWQPLVVCARPQLTCCACARRAAQMPAPVRGGAGRKRAASAPPQRPEQPAAPPQQGTADSSVPATLDGELVQLPAGTNYDSLDENDGPTGDILEDAELVGVADKCPVETAQAARGSPSRAQTVLTNAKE
eukprot:7385972-Prymnesium_polylepis.1